MIDCSIVVVVVVVVVGGGGGGDGGFHCSIQSALPHANVQMANTKTNWWENQAHIVSFHDQKCDAQVDTSSNQQYCHHGDFEIRS